MGCLADRQSKSPPLKSSLGDCPKSQSTRQELDGLYPSLAYRPEVEDASWTSLGLILPVASERFIGMGQAKVVTAGKG